MAMLCLDDEGCEGPASHLGCPSRFVAEAPDAPTISSLVPAPSRGGGDGGGGCDGARRLAAGRSGQ